MKYVLSDIHGNKKNWDSILQKINLQDTDDLYVLGDVIDRHPYGIEILQDIMSRKNVHMLMGNHEYMMIRALFTPYSDEHQRLKAYTQWAYSANGGNVTLEAFDKLPADQQDQIEEFLESLPLYFDVITDNGAAFKLCHCTLPELYIPYRTANPDMIYHDEIEFSVWERGTIGTLATIEDFTTVFGHTCTLYLDETIQKDIQVVQIGSAIGIDCGSGFPDDPGFPYQGRLACLRLDDMEVVYSE